MKKKIMLVAAAVIIVAAGGWGVYHSNASQAEPKLSPSDIKQIVQDQYPGEIMELDLDKDFSKAVYTVAIEGEKKIYELKMDGNTGEVLKLKEMLQIPEAAKSKEDEAKSLGINEKKEEPQEEEQTKKEKKNDQTSNSDSKSESETEQKQSGHDDNSKYAEKHANNSSKHKQKTVISAEEASRIALNQFSGTITELELDEDDGRYIYEIEIEDGNDREAEFEIDAMTGKTISIEIDDD
ncbi:PepSY domain-containing protein [Virgibacillus halophilus]|uniref:PepSY domain-containing protein n=1 Tax=Tigheibacillus halophilus TaxID=361280 RepID=A0ABU5C815_9BACI|nr:PepSY domain-containing protein [Virgibacillus halophilus]